MTHYTDSPAEIIVYYAVMVVFVVCVMLAIGEMG